MDVTLWFNIFLPNPSSTWWANSFFFILKTSKHRRKCVYHSQVFYGKRQHISLTNTWDSFRHRSGILGIFLKEFILLSILEFSEHKTTTKGRRSRIWNIHKQTRKLTTLHKLTVGAAKLNIYGLFQFPFYIMNHINSGIRKRASPFSATPLGIPTLVMFLPPSTAQVC